MERKSKCISFNKIVFTVLALIDIAGYIALFIMIRNTYKFFVLESISTFVICSIMIFTPLVACAILFFVYEHMNKSSKRWAVFAVILSFIVMLISSITLLLVSPFGSETNDKNNFLKIDAQSGVVDSTFGGLIPSEIPSSATNIKYNYRYYRNPENLYEIFVQWTLPEEEYVKEKERISKKYSGIMHSKYGDFYSIYISQDENSAYDYIFFAYDDDTRTVRYVVSYIESAEDYDITPYYKSMDW